MLQTPRTLQELYKIIKDISSDESKEKLITRNMKNNTPP